MLKIENTEVMGWEAAIRGMRNPMNSWNKSDTIIVDVPDTPRLDYSGNVVEIIPAHKQVVMRYEDENWNGIGENDIRLMTTLRNAGTDHRKFMRMITVYLDITAPLYWWKEFKTYRAGRKFGDDEPEIIDEGYLEYDIEMNSCSTMHKIQDKEFTLEDFSSEHLENSWLAHLKETIRLLNEARDAYHWCNTDAKKSGGGR